MTERILVTDGDQRAALACVRALGASGHACYVAGPRGRSLAAKSRHCLDALDCSDPSSDPERFLDDLSEAVRRWKITTLIPVTEKSLRVVLPRRSEIEPVLLPFPEAQVFEAVSDKAKVLRVARQIGIDVPRQWVWTSPEGVGRSEVPDSAFPLAVKPTTSVAEVGRPMANSGVRYLETRREMEEWLARGSELAFPCLVQERIQGEGVGVFLLLWEGELRAVVGHRRIREKPPSGGVSVVRESTKVDPGLLDRSVELLRRLGWRSGVAMVEFKREIGSGIPYLMEINGRFWGSLQLALDSGVDFPSLLVQAGRGHLPSATVVGKPGVRTRWLMGDLDHLLLILSRRRSTLNLPLNYPGRVQALGSFLLDFRPGVRSEVLRLTDPGPFFSEVRTWWTDLHST